MSQRVAIITGGGRGLGRAFAKRLAEDGNTVIIAEIDQESADKVKEEIISSGYKAYAIKTDVTDEFSVKQMVEEVCSACGRIDILVNNAALLGTLKRGPFEEITVDEFELAMRVNVTGSFIVTKAVIEVMRKTSWGRIINMSSDTALNGNPGFLHYVTTKGAIVSMTRALAREVGPNNITVNAIQPGLTETEVERGEERKELAKKVISAQCIPRQELPEDLVGAISFLASEDSDFITGQTIAVNGGISFR